MVYYGEFDFKESRNVNIYFLHCRGMNKQLLVCNKELNIQNICTQSRINMNR